MWGSTNYLGLTADPRVRQAAIEAVGRYGAGCTGSRLMNGTLTLHAELEAELADWLGYEACLVFTTGYAANLGVVGSLVGEGDAMFADMGSHASLVDGGRLAHGTVRWWRHNSPTSLRSRLARCREEGGGGAARAPGGPPSTPGARHARGGGGGRAKGPGPASSGKASPPSGTTWAPTVEAPSSPSTSAPTGTRRGSGGPSSTTASTSTAPSP